MNNGFYGFPNSNYGTSVIEVKEFDTSGSYVIPNGAKRLSIMLIGGGGGGGGGRRNITGAGNGSYGGGGGAGGTINLGYFFVETIGGSPEANSVANAGQSSATPGRILNIVLGAGGSGGAGATADSTNGSGGNPGGASTISATGMPGFMMYSSGGAQGSGGGSTTGSAGTGQPVMFNGAPYPSSSPVNLTGGTNGIISLSGNSSIDRFTLTGGQGGGGVNNATAAAGIGFSSASSTTVPAITDGNYARGGTIKSGGATNTATSEVSEQLTVAGRYTPGLGGVGGGGGSATSANNGTNGWRGGGGGGGGGANNGITAGNGGAGGNGYCVIIAYG